jgi:hypothetical protein
MKLHKVLYSRTARKDYRWIFRPPSKFLTDSIQQTIWSKYKASARNYSKTECPFIFFYVSDEEFLIARCRETDETDMHSRPILALEGLYGGHAQCALLAEISHLVVGCHDIVLDFSGQNYDGVEDETAEQVIDVDDVNQEFWRRYENETPVQHAEDVKAKAANLKFDSEGFRELVSILEGGWRYGVKSFAFGLPDDIDESKWAFNIEVPLSHARATVLRLDSEIGKRKGEQRVPESGAKVIAEVIMRAGDDYGMAKFHLLDVFSKEVLATSKQFQWRARLFRSAKLDSRDVYANFDAFIEEVLKKGWRPRLDRGGEWWSVRFEN